MRTCRCCWMLSLMACVEWAPYGLRSAATGGGKVSRHDALAGQQRCPAHPYLVAKLDGPGAGGSTAGVSCTRSIMLSQSVGRDRPGADWNTHIGVSGAESGECSGASESKGKGSGQGFTCMRGDVGAAAAAAAADGDTAAGRLLPGMACNR